ncbi:unknown [Bacteroides clarus CAG:160]|nr:unknown [Bacteroides clarus CAG:160]
MPISFSGIGRKETQHFTFNVLLAFLFQFLTDMSGYGIDIGLQHFHILENGMIDTLQYVIGGIGSERAYFIGVINKAGP